MYFRGYIDILFFHMSRRNGYIWQRSLGGTSRLRLHRFFNHDDSRLLSPRRFVFRPSRTTFLFRGYVLGLFSSFHIIFNTFLHFFRNCFRIFGHCRDFFRHFTY